MRHSSVLLSAQSASHLKKNDQPLLALTRAATLKTTTPARARLMRGIATAAILLLTIPPAAEAGPGGGGRGGGFRGHVGGESARGVAGRGGGVGVWGLSEVLSAARVSAVAALDRSEEAISPGGPLRRRGRASQRRASLPITLRARA